MVPTILRAGWRNSALRTVLGVALAAALSACGGDDAAAPQSPPVATPPPTAPTPTPTVPTLPPAASPSIATGTLSVPITAANARVLQQMDLVFPGGVAAFGTSITTTVVFNDASATPSFTIRAGAQSASGFTTFGSCIFNVQLSTLPGLPAGTSVISNPCLMQFLIAGTSADGSTVTRPVQLVLGTLTSGSVTVPVQVAPSGQVTVNGQVVGTVDVGTSILPSQPTPTPTVPTPTPTTPTPTPTTPAPTPTTPPVVETPTTPPAPAIPTCSAAVATATHPLNKISAVQGTSNNSPKVGQGVTVRGVVTGVFQGSGRLNGFFIQDPEPDADPLTSEALFVFAPSAAAVAVGQYLQVSGNVAEFGTAPANATQLSGTVVVSLCGTGVTVNPTTINLPVADLADLERYENMLVQFPQTLGVTELFELGQFGQLAVGLGGRQFHPNNGNVVTTRDQNLRSRIIIDDGSTSSWPNPTPYMSAAGSAGTRRMGDLVTGVTGVLGHAFGAYRLHPTVAPTFSAPSRPALPVVGGSLKVGHMNVLNYFTTLNQRGANTAAELTRQRAKTVEAIFGLDADVLGLMEVENGTAAIDDLVTAVNAKYGTTTYAHVSSGTFGTDQIKVDIIYKPSKVARVGGLELMAGTDLTQYTTASGRPPMAQRFRQLSNNGQFWFVVNHFKSKGSCPGSGDVDTGQGCWNEARKTQSFALNSFVTKLQALGETDVLMMGDFNAYIEEDPAKVLEAAGHENLEKRIPAASRYSYVFDGESGSLDHAYASNTLKAQVAGIGVWHINADEPTVLDYNTENKTDDRYAVSPYRVSDHDPVLVGLNLTADAVVSLPVLAVDIPANGQATSAYGMTVTVADPSSPATLSTLTVAWGDGTADTSLASAGPATHTYATAGTYTVLVTLVNSSNQTVTRSGTVTVAAAPAATADLFFSEYIEGSSNNKALEIYNPTTATVSLTGYAVKFYFNGNTSVGTTISLTGSISPGGVLVIANNAATATFKTAPNLITSTASFYNGDDAVVLEKSGVVIDRIGQIGFDPGTNWTSGGVATSEQTLRRKSSVKIGDNNSTGAFDPALQWDSFPQDTSNGLGAHTVDP